MNVRTKILLLLLLVVVSFIWGLIAIQRRDDREFAAILQKREADRTATYDQFSKHWGESLGTFADFVSCWDEMVTAIRSNDTTWGESNLSDSALASYRSQVVWVYRADATLFMTRNVLYSDALSAVPLDAEEIQKLINERRMCHFYAWTPTGLMEVRGASIHPSGDTGRTTEAAGYFFAGRIWTITDLKEISLFTGNQVEWIKPAEMAAVKASDVNSGTVRFVRPLPGWNGIPVAALRITSESPVVAQMRRSNMRGLQWLIVFALAVFLIMSISLVRWVTMPLRSLSESLRRQDPEGLEWLERNHGEFGAFAGMISRFFLQQQDLIRKTEDRRVMEEALEKSEEQLRHSQKMEAIGQLAGGIAHDFNNLLTAIIGYSEMLMARMGRDPVSRQQVDVILKAGQQAASLTRQLLAFSRKQILQPRVVDLNDLIHALQHLLQRLLGETIQLQVHTEASPALVLADPTQLEQVVINLCVNARDAMPQGGVLTIRTSEQSPGKDGVKAKRSICLSVSDTGTGMNDETKERIFEPFFTTKEVGKGTGLGLATVYGIVQQSGGTISVESEPGDGTTFHLVLPEAVGEVEKRKVADKKPALVRATETLLVVEDEEIVRDFVCAALGDQGYHILCASNGVDGLKVASAYDGEICLLITDVIMPEMNGPELSRQLAAIRPGMRVLFVSGYSDNDLARHGTLPMEINFLEKPFSPATLNRKVRAVLDGNVIAENNLASALPAGKS